MDTILHAIERRLKMGLADAYLEQVVGAHGGKAGIHRTQFAHADLVDGRLHVVLDAAPRHTTECFEGSCVGVEQHLIV